MSLRILCLTIAVLAFVIPNAASGEISQGDTVTIIVPGTVARLCPHPNCGQDQHITRIPEGTKLEIEGIMDVKSGMMEVKWFEVRYKGKRGWISIYNTDKAQ